MSLVLTAAPAVEPVPLADAKAHLRVDDTAEDGFIQSLIVTSRLHIEAAIGLALIEQAWSWTIDAWREGGGIALPMRPVREIGSVRIVAADMSYVTVDPARYVLDGHGAPARLLPATVPLPAPAIPAGGIEITFTAGFGVAPADVPAPIKQALHLLVAHWFENREPVSIGAAAARPHRIPDTVTELLAPYRIARL